MNLTLEQIGDIDIITVAGRLAFDASSEFDASLRSALSESAHSKVILEISSVSFVSSPVLRSILTLAKRLKRQKGRLFLVGATDDVMEVFRVSGFISLGVFELSDRDGAIHALNEASSTSAAGASEASSPSSLPPFSSTDS
ncbi:MAG: STAS domain-containing protein [Verrucomicrobia bacterium]|nr:STAS domain-containing protein [Verrucomicrobiota bacterium]